MTATLPIELPSSPLARLLSEAPLLKIPAAYKKLSLPAPTPKTCLRFALSGHRGVVLETIKSGGRRLTTVPALLRFLEATQPTKPQPRAAVGIDAVAADKVLEAFGLGREVAR
jgi:hypothetical protein